MTHGNPDRSESLVFTRVQDAGIGVIHGAAFGVILAAVSRILKWDPVLTAKGTARYMAFGALVFGAFDGIFGGHHTRREQQRRNLAELQQSLCVDGGLGR